jgi:hypothetical protein
MLKEKYAQELLREVTRPRADDTPGKNKHKRRRHQVSSLQAGYDQVCVKSSSSGVGRMTAKAAIPPVNGNEIKVLVPTARPTHWRTEPERRLLLCFWSNNVSVLGFAFIIGDRDINGILMTCNRRQEFRNGSFLVPSAVIVA